jgi:hypothetical protein
MKLVSYWSAILIIFLFMLFIGLRAPELFKTTEFQVFQWILFAIFLVLFLTRRGKAK